MLEENIQPSEKDKENQELLDVSDKTVDQKDDKGIVAFGKIPKRGN